MPETGDRRLRLRLASLFWLQLVLSPLFSSPLSQRFDYHQSPLAAVLVFLIAPLLYSTSLAWLWQRRGSRRTPVFCGATCGMLFGLLGFLPHALWGIVGLNRAFDPSLPISRWTLLAESVQMLVVLLFFMCFYALVGIAGGALVQAAGACGGIDVRRPRLALARGGAAGRDDAAERESGSFSSLADGPAAAGQGPGVGRNGTRPLFRGGRTEVRGSE